MINLGDDPNGTRVEDYVHRWKLISVSQGFLQFDRTDRCRGVVGGDAYTLFRREQMMQGACKDADVVGEFVRFDHFKRLLVEPDDPCAWLPCREVLEDDIPAFIHCPREVGPLDTVAVMFMTFNMTVTKIKKGLEGTDLDALLR